MTNKMKIINLTQHMATPEQVAAGVVEPDDKSAVREVLTFGALPNAGEITRQANILTAMAAKYSQAMIGGAPYLMGPLEAALKASGIIPLYAFSVRESVETSDPQTGVVTKTQRFRHLGFIIGQVPGAK